jgi:hypothetical protein
MSIKVFVSSTSKDLAAYRGAAERAVLKHEMHPIMMERFPAASRDAVDVCRAQVERADLLIGIYARRYGYIPRGEDSSITELEYRWAERAGVDRLIFVLDEASAALPAEHPINQYADQPARMATFLNHVGQGVVWRSFTTPENLEHEVYRALEEWGKRPLVPRALRGLRAVPIAARFASALLLLLTLIIVGGTVWNLAQAGSQAISSITGIIGLITAFTPLLGLVWAGGRAIWMGNITPLRLPAWAGALIIQIIILAVIWWISPHVMNIAATEMIAQAITEPAGTRARAAADGAQRLGLDVATHLESELTRLITLSAHADEADWIALTRLFALYASDRERSVLAEEMSGAVRVTAALEPGRTALLLDILSILDVKEAVSEAEWLYNSALTAVDSNPPATARAAAYLDGLIGAQMLPRTPVLSEAYYVRGLMLEETRIDEAFELYRQALALDDTLLHVRYALASGLLVRAEQGGSVALLDDAITIARSGHTQYIDPRWCQGRQNLTTPEAFSTVWYCFILMTTEAGARAVRGAPEDTFTLTGGLLERAIRLAEANDHFTLHAGFFTGEAYAWYARLTQPDPATESGARLYCDVLAYTDGERPRHTPWREDASARLASSGRSCAE